MRPGCSAWSFCRVAAEILLPCNQQVFSVVFPFSAAPRAAAPGSSIMLSRKPSVCSVLFAFRALPKASAPRSPMLFSAKRSVCSVLFTCRPSARSLVPSSPRCLLDKSNMWPFQFASNSSPFNSKDCKFAFSAWPNALAPESPILLSDKNRFFNVVLACKPSPSALVPESSMLLNSKFNFCQVEFTFKASPTNAAAAAPPISFSPMSNLFHVECA
mmetsp:Transcript_114538/g.364046  ORF Transcript_114538/g.364046 Transcript_114538/m.364046 type:complete len:215 (-) Transcript_114538:1829-2473(-)